MSRRPGQSDALIHSRQLVAEQVVPSARDDIPGLVLRVNSPELRGPIAKPREALRFVPVQSRQELARFREVVPGGDRCRPPPRKA